MNTSIFKSTAIACTGLIALSLGGTVWAEGCIAPDPKYPILETSTSVDLYGPTFVNPSVDENGVPLYPDTYVAPRESIPVPSVTEFDGSMTCDSTSGYFGGFIVGASGTETFTSGNVQFTVTSYVDPNGKAVWNVVPADPPPPAGITELRGIDATISASNKGSKGCNTTFGVDAGSGMSAYQKSNGTYVASDLFVCANTTYDPVPAPQPAPPAIVEGCGVLDDGDAIIIHGVTVSCGGVPPGEQRTIFVAINTADDGSGIKPVPGFGFANEKGVIDFSNVCICNGPDSVDAKVTCDPSPLPDDPETDALPDCTVSEDSLPALNLTIQNPICIGYGGSRRCY